MPRSNEISSQSLKEINDSISNTLKPEINGQITETQERTDCGEKIANEISKITPSLKETQELKNKLISDANVEGEKVQQDLIDKQEKLTDICSDFTTDLIEKGSKEDKNREFMASSRIVAQQGGFKTDFLNRYIDKTADHIKDLNENVKEVNENHNDMIKSNNAAFAKMKEAFDAIK